MVVMVAAQVRASRRTVQHAQVAGLPLSARFFRRYALCRILGERGRTSSGLGVRGNRRLKNGQMLPAVTASADEIDFQIGAKLEPLLVVCFAGHTVGLVHA
jgi:hypothetical protein